MHTRTLLALLVTIAGTTSLGCASSRGGGASGRTAEETYQRAMEDLADSLYPEAIAGFAEVKTKFPYSKFAALADLRTADTHYEQSKYLEAVDAYRQFLKLHPNHAEAPYAMWRIGESYAEQAPGDHWFLPPAAEKDQADVRLAIDAYRDMLARYPKSDYSAKAQAKLDSARQHLASHELYVAEFYWQRDKYQAAAARAEGMLRDYSGLGLDPQALWLSARARARLGEVAPARAAAERLVTQFPKSEEASGARQLIAELLARPAAGAATPQEQGG